SAQVGELRAVQLIFGGADQVDGLAICLFAPTRWGAACHVVELAKGRHHRGRVDGLVAGLVVQRDVAAGDRNTKLHAGIGQAADTLGQLPHDIRILWGTVVQAVRNSRRDRAGGGDVAVGFGQCQLGADVWVQVGVATVGIGSDGNAQAGGLVD